MNLSDEQSMHRTYEPYGPKHMKEFVRTFSPECYLFFELVKKNKIVGVKTGRV